MIQFHQIIIHIYFLGQELDKMNKTFDKVDGKLEDLDELNNTLKNNALDLTVLQHSVGSGILERNLNKLSIGSALLNIDTLNTDISK